MPAAGAVSSAGTEPAPWPASARWSLTSSRRTAFGCTADRHAAPEADADLALALPLWRIAGEATEAVPVLDSVLDSSEGRQWFRWAAARAAREIAVLGPAGRPLTARLEVLLDDPTQARSAVLGLLGVADQAGLDHTWHAEAALHSAETRADLKDACDALRALSAAALTPGQHGRRVVLAAGVRRLIVFGSDHAMIREDEQLRAVLASVLGRVG